jgi:hypothetical protein
MLSPDEYENFFQKLQERNLDDFKSNYEEKLLRYSKSNQIMLTNKIDESEKETLDLEILEELDKTIDELIDSKLKE